jgi:hypothetical protein
VASVPLPAPTILSTDSLEELRIERDGELLWQRQAEKDLPIEGPIPWPLPPLRPGERLVLMLRPKGVPAGEYALIILQGDRAERMRWAQAELERLGKDTSAWWLAIRQAFDREDLSLGLALLFAFDGPSSPRLDNLRREVFLAGCGDSGGGLNVTPSSPRTASRLIPDRRTGAAEDLLRSDDGALSGVLARLPGGPGRRPAWTAAEASGNPPGGAGRAG